jgi:hypothetical protein
VARNDASGSFYIFPSQLGPHHVFPGVEDRVSEVRAARLREDAGDDSFESDLVRVAQRMDALENATSAHRGEPPTFTVVD